MTAQHKNARRDCFVPRNYWSAALHRLEDAEALVIMAQGRREKRRGDKRRWAGARYIAGIAVECMIKYAICIWHDLTYVDEKFPELITSRGHDLAYGMEKLGLHRAVVYSEVAHDWEKVLQWNVNWRYEPGDGNPEECRQFVEACSRVNTWIAQTVV